MPAEMRRCPRCREIFPATPEFFYQRPVDSRLEYCNQNANDCHGQYWRARSRRVRVGPVIAHVPKIPFVDESQIERIPPHMRRYGVEIEFSRGRPQISLNRVVNALHQHGVPADMFRRDGMWVVHAEHCGIEVSGPPLTSFQQLEMVCGTLAQLGVRTNINCGLHVHLDGGDMTGVRFKQLIQSWTQHDRLVRELVSRSRRPGGSRVVWCEPIGPSYKTRLMEVPDDGHEILDPAAVRGRVQYAERYYALNPRAYYKYATLEFRLHQGSVNYRRIRAWIEFLRGFWEASITGQLDRDIDSVQELVGVVHSCYDRVDGRFLTSRSRSRVLAEV